MDKQLAFNGTLLEIKKKNSKGLIWVVSQGVVSMGSLNVNRNLHKFVYAKLEKYGAKIDDVCS